MPRRLYPPRRLIPSLSIPTAIHGYINDGRVATLLNFDLTLASRSK
jgi:hypothetical protein